MKIALDLGLQVAGHLVGIPTAHHQHYFQELANEKEASG
jgi:hypothetical protein